MAESEQAAGSPDVAAVVIGRNEGERLVACLASLAGSVARLVYVDSGSTDDSVAAAGRAGAEVVALDLSVPFTAARARNAGLARLRGQEAPRYVQLVDGDCSVEPGWIDTARAFLEAHPKAAVACGRRRERFPEASIYNRLCDREWDTPIGRARACGGDALMRMAPLEEGGGYREDLIAGEEPELCVRLRQAGWEIWRLDAPMTRHDAAMTRFGQWWRRSMRAGHAFAEGAALHGAPPERHYVAETRRAIAWGVALPVAIIAAFAAVGPAALLLALAYPAQVARLAARDGITRSESWAGAVFNTLGKFAEARGALGYCLGRLRAQRPTLIEYK